MPLILASASSIRSAMLDAAGVEHRIDPSRFDETSVKRDHDGADSALALALARGKALDISARHSNDWIIGGDSVVSVNGCRYGKPADREEAKRHLEAFSGQAMTLTSAAVLARDGVVDWQQADSAVLRVRSLSPEFIHNYLDREWPAVGACVGVFRMEGPGVQLFEAIEGSHFTILGMPLLPLLDALRERGVIAR